jgi:hypothetical protein
MTLPSRIAKIPRTFLPVAGLLLSCISAAAQERITFTTSQKAEVIAELDLSSPLSDWAVRGREAAVAAVRVDGGTPMHVFVFAGPVKATYRVLLGSLAPGEHQLTVARDEAGSARGSQLQFIGARFREVAIRHPDYPAYANMPVLFIRKNTIGKFSDIPLLAYCERLDENGVKILQYTVIFSNEDGGTSTRALMARWGRTTDIEYIYRAYLDSEGTVARSTVQAPGHKEADYTGKRDAAHPLLMPVTDNNMVAEVSDAPLRFQLAPDIVSLDSHSREQVMDDAPATYLVMAKELQREGKLRPFGVQAAEKISDPRNYAYFEYKAKHANSALTVAVHLKNGHAYSSDLGRLDYSIWRDGWVRTTVELPPGTKMEQIGAVEFRCLVAPPAKNEPFAHSGRCQLDRVSKAFFLNEEYAPAASFWKLDAPVTLKSGESASFQP